MTTNNKMVTGAVEWNSVGNENKGKKFENTKDLWLRLNDGENRIRIVTVPFQYLVHTYKKEGDKGFGQKVYCSAPNGSCPLCEKGDPALKSKRRWLVGCIERKTGTFKILDMGWTIFDHIKQLSSDPDWGSPTLYDLKIFVDRNGGATGYYKVLAQIPKPLSVADLEIIEGIDLEMLKAKTNPPTYEQVLARIAKIDGDSGAPAPAGVVATQQTSKPAKAKTTVDTSGDDSDIEFPDHE